MRLISAFSALLFALSSQSAAALVHPSLETVLKSSANLHQYGAVAVSASGRYVAFTRDGALYVAEASGASRKLTVCPGCAVGEVAWSARDDRIAAIAAAANGQAQVYVVSPAGLSTRLTSLHGILANPRWSPSGDRVAFLFIKDAPRLPGPLNPAERQVGVIGNATYEQRIATVPATGGEVRFASPADTYIYEFDWSPNASQFVAIEAKGDGDNNWWIAKLALIESNTGALRVLYDPPLQMANPRWSPDGKSIELIGGLMSDESVTGGDVYRISASSGEAADLTEGNPASISAFEWAQQPDRIVATEIAGGATALVTIDAATKSLTQLWRGDVHVRSSAFPFDVGSIALSRGGEMSATIQESFSAPPAVVAGPAGAWHVVDDADAHAARWLGPARSITWKNGDVSVQGWLIAPFNQQTGVKYPMVVIPHGGPAYASLPIFPQAPETFEAAFASQGYYVFEPNPRGSYGQGEAFTKANIRDFGGADLQDILAGVDAVNASAALDSNRVGIFGWSYGGFMTMWAVTQTQRFRAAVAGAGIANWQSYYGENGIDTWAVPYMGASVYDDPAAYAKMSPINFIRAVKTPTLIVVGERDDECPASQSFEFWHALHDRGVTTELVVYADEGHLFYKMDDSIDVTRRTVGWFDRYMP